MWLLSTKKLRLAYFSSPEDVQGGYAILSHVWRPQEQSFQTINAFVAEGIKLGDRRVCSKIRRCCILARADGYNWVWVDTCCIDKTSSAELSEAINSMYRWYALAGVCYVYLHDVSSTCQLDTPRSQFRKSVWFTRGWTLQELIAPRFILFLSQDWQPLGTKAALSDLIQEITDVDIDVLTSLLDVESVSIARRMSWASRRQTSRVEDQAYCLMGIFGVNMPTLYGEGVGAFRRLQEEVMKHSADQSLFAWGDILPDSIPKSQLVPDAQEPANFLFAPSPAAFANSGHISCISLGKAVQEASSCFNATLTGNDSPVRLILALRAQFGN